MEKIFQNKSIIITGAGQGIGLEIACHLAALGAGIVVNDIDDSLCEMASKKITGAGGRCVSFPGDAADLELIQKMVEGAIIEYGQLDIVIANAGITLFGDFLTYNPTDFNRVMQLNLQGSFYLAQTAAKEFIKQGTGGSILFMSSVTGHQAHKNLAAYSMSKAALEMLAKNLVIELSPYQININCIAPGATLTERTLSDPEYTNTWAHLTPLGRAASVTDIAQAVAFLVSPAAKHITGQSLVIDGGWTSVSPSPF